MLLVSDRQLTRGMFTHPAGIPFEESDENIAVDLVKRGVARKAEPPRIIYATVRNKSIGPENGTDNSQERNRAERDLASGEFQAREVKPVPGDRFPASYSPVPDEESQEMAPASDTVLPKPDVPEQRTADRIGRRGRKGHRSR
jgi:hypothetical protein